MIPGLMVFAQPGPKSVTIQVIDQSTQAGLARKGVSLLNVGSGVTDDNGLVRVTIPNGITTIELQLPPGFEIVNPPGPIQNVPSSANAVVKFWVKTALLENMKAQIDQLIRDKQNLSKSVNDLETELASLQDLNKELLSNSAGKQDSIERVRTQMRIKDQVIDSLSRKVMDVDSKIGDYKLAIFSEISRNYQQFLNAMLNMEMNLKDIKGAFINEGELKNFNSIVEILNVARDDLHEKHLAYIEAAETYWNKGVSAKLSGLYNQAIVNTYGNLIIPLNEDLVGRLKAAWSGKQSRLVAQKQARKSLKKVLPKLRQEIEDMERIAEEVFVQLKEDG